MNRFGSTLLLSAALLLGAGTAHAALPDKATLFKNPECGCCDEYARQLEARGVEVKIVDDIEVGKIKQRVGLPYGLGSCHTIQMGVTPSRVTCPSRRWRNSSRNARTPAASAWPACPSAPPACLGPSGATGTSTSSAAVRPNPS